MIYMGTKTLERESAPPDWVRWVTSDDLATDGFFLSSDTTSRVSPGFAAVYANGRLRAGELLVKVKGPNQLAAFVPSVAEEQTVLVSGTIWGAIVRAKEIDPWYLTAVLEAPYGRIARARRRTNLNVEFVAPSDLVRVRIPEPDRDAQAYIGNKVRQAETLRARARNLVVDATSFFAPLHTRSGAWWRGTWRRAPAELEEGRMDAWFYATAPTDLESRLRAGGADTVSSRVVVYRNNAFNSSKAIEYFEIGNLDTSTGCVWPSRVDPDAIPSRAQRSVRAWDILVSTVRPERKNIALIGPDGGGQLVASSGFAVLRSPTPEEAAFVCWFLRSDAGTDQLLRWNTGAAYPAIDDDVPLKTLMPSYNPSEVRRQGARWKQIPELLHHARALTAAARLLVEALIERKVTEKELIAAHKDPATDRALLARLASDGLDGDREPLFPDLDRLEELLKDAMQGEQE